MHIDRSDGEHGYGSYQVMLPFWLYISCNTCLSNVAKTGDLGMKVKFGVMGTITRTYMYIVYLINMCIHDAFSKLHTCIMA